MDEVRTAERRIGVSVVITNYNYGRFLSAAINSALALEYPSVQVIVVDDGSTDDSRQVVAGYGQAVTLLTVDRGGQGAAMNAGWRAANGEIVFFLDADDMLLPDVAARVTDRFMAHPDLSRVQFSLEIVDEEGHRTGGLIPRRGKRLFAGDPQRALLAYPDDIVWQPTSGNAFAKRALDAVLPIPEEPYRLCADYYLLNLTALYGSVAALDQIGGRYRAHGRNGHFAARVSLDRLRSDIVRTRVTHAELQREARRMNLTPTTTSVEDVRSVTSVASRLISYRLDRGRHPIDTDRRMSLLLIGLRSSIARADCRWWRRLAFAGWFSVAAVVPRSLIRYVARPFVQLSSE